MGDQAPRKPTASESRPAGHVRLSVNLSPPVAAALKDLAERHDMTLTEEVRRAISFWKFVNDSYRDGAILLLETQDGRVRELLINSDRI